MFLSSFLKAGITLAVIHIVNTCLTRRRQTQIRHEPSHKQQGVKTNRTSFLCENRSGHHNTELRTSRHMIGQNVGQQYAYFKNITFCGVFIFAIFEISKKPLNISVKNVCLVSIKIQYDVGLNWCIGI